MTPVIPDTPKRANPYLERIRLVRGSITEQDVDAIVTLMPQNLEYRGELNARILKEAGASVDAFVLENIYRPNPGDIYSVPGFDLPCRHIFFCIVPVWRDDFDRTQRQLLNVARRAMETAREMGLSTIAFAPIGSGRRGFPKPRAARLILKGIAERMHVSIREVRIVARTDETLAIFQERLDKMKAG